MLNNSLVARRFSSMTRSTTLLTNRFRHLAAGRRQLHENVPVLRRFLQNVGHSSPPCRIDRVVRQSGGTNTLMKAAWIARSRLLSRYALNMIGIAED